MVTVDAPETVKAVVGLRLVCRDRNEDADYTDLSKWRVMAGKLDWDRIADSENYAVLANYGAPVEVSVLEVTAGCGDHRVLVVQPDGSRVERIIPAEQVLPTARLFVSCLVRRKRLEVRFKRFEQLGAHFTYVPPFMVIRPV